jgi:hypothetical protein
MGMSERCDYVCTNYGSLGKETPSIIQQYFKPMILFYFVAKFHYFAIKKSPQQHSQGGPFRKILRKNHPISRGKSFEITKIFGGFGQIFSFLLLKLPYLTNRF